MIINWSQFDLDCRVLATLIGEHSFYNQRNTTFYAIPRGGFFVAARVAYYLNMDKDKLHVFNDQIVLGMYDFIVDDIFDTGMTYNEILDMKSDTAFACLYAKERITSIPSKVLIGRQLKTEDHVYMPWGD